MLLSKTAIVKWNAKIKNRYVALGYEFTKMNDEFNCRIEDLSKGSSSKVSVKCDYCGNVFTIPYKSYLNRLNKTINKDCCNKCKSRKIQDSLQRKYGADCIRHIDGMDQKIKDGTRKKYGVDNAFQSEEIKQKIRETNILRYGVDNPSQSNVVVEKRRETCKKKYGATHHMKTDKYKEMLSGENSPRWKPDKSDEERERDRSTEEYRSWRSSVFKRDGYKCACCGGRGDRKLGIQAHHIRNWKDNEELRYNIDNGITLCARCHYDFHSKYGKKDNDIFQLNEFIYQGKKIC